jgi:hypothetical protein
MVHSSGAYAMPSPSFEASDLVAISFEAAAAILKHQTAKEILGIQGNIEGMQKILLKANSKKMPKMVSFLRSISAKN